MNKQRKPPKKVEPWVLEEAKRLYATGKYSLADIGKELGYSTATIYYLLKGNGCKFNHKWKHPASEEFRKRQGDIHRGKTLSEEQRHEISERNSCNYNGMNGYGHTKPHRKGYILAYVPDHPHAHKDGYVMLHKVLMEREIGRYLNPDEVVHHINHIRDDNRIENLRLMSKHDHMSIHMKERHAKRRNDLSTAS